MNLDEIYSKLPKDLIDYKDFINIFKDMINKDNNYSKKEEMIIKTRIYKLVANSNYRMEFLNYFIDNNLKTNSLNNVNGFFNKLDSVIDYENNDINIDDIIKLLNNNSKFYNITDSLYNLYKIKINKYGLSKFTSNYFFSLTIQAYLLINHIELEEVKPQELDTIEYNTDGFRQYLNEIGKYPRLSREEERTLLIKAQSGDLEARNKFIECNLKLVAYIVYSKYSRRKLSMLDLIDEGNIGLIRAIEKYNINLGVKFSSYASYWIENYINKALYRQTRNISLPIKMQDKIVRYKKQYKVLEDKLGRTPTIDELIIATGYDNESINLVRQYLNDTISENECLRGIKVEDNDQSLLDCIKDQNINIEEDIIHNNEINILKYILNTDCLTKQEKDVIKRRYGFNGKIEKLEEIGRSYKLSRERIRQIELHAINKIKKELVKIKINNLSQTKFRSLYDYFPNYNCNSIDYIVSNLSDDYRDLLSKIYIDNYNNSNNCLLSLEDKDIIIRKIIPTINELLYVVFDESLEIIDDQVLTDLLYIINVYDIRNIFNDISRDTLTIGLLKDGYVDNKKYNIKTISKLLSLNIFETYNKYQIFSNYMNNNIELQNILDNKIKLYMRR